MKIIMVHNYYRQRAGEDASFEAEAKLLESKGHKVIRYTRDNNEIKHNGRFKHFINMIWNKKTYKDLSEIIKKENPDWIHFQNIHAIISPSGDNIAACFTPRTFNIISIKCSCFPSSEVRSSSNWRNPSSRRLFQ